ncbi:auxin-binding protein, partial [Mesorhizobium sp. M7A.F.Ca.CA.004.05.1.1]
MASIWRYLLAGLGLAALLVGILAVVFLTAPRSSLPAGPDVSRTKNTANALFVA